MPTEPEARGPREHRWTTVDDLAAKVTADGRYYAEDEDAELREVGETSNFEDLVTEILRLAAREEELVARVRELEEWIEGEARHSDSCALFEPYRLVEGKDNECSCGLAALRRKP